MVSVKRRRYHKLVAHMVLGLLPYTHMHMICINVVKYYDVCLLIRDTSAGRAFCISQLTQYGELFARTVPEIVVPMFGQAGQDVVKEEAGVLRVCTWTYLCSAYDRSITLAHILALKEREEQGARAFRPESQRIALTLKRLDSGSEFDWVTWISHDVGRIANFKMTITFNGEMRCLTLDAT